LPVPLTSFVGREWEAAEVRRLLGQTRLLTLTGAGGCGKTRLALHVAAGATDAYADGVAFIPLAAESDPALVPARIAEVLQAPEEPGRPIAATLADRLRDHELLLILDNCEQVCEAGPAIAELLAACPRLTTLVTSRALLHVAGEYVFAVPPLASPAPDASGARPPAPAGHDADADGGVEPFGPGPLLEYAAVRLFVERARAVQPGFELTEHNAPAVAAICARLDGLPLAIELAAARVRVLTPRAILTRLTGDDPAGPFQFLTGGARNLPSRQQTLAATIAWSYDLLTEDERACFRRLAVFSGGWTVEAAAPVCDLSPDPSPTGGGEPHATVPAASGLGSRPRLSWHPTPAEAPPSLAGKGESERQRRGSGLLDLLTALADKSLVRPAPGRDDEPRFGMLVVIREFAQARLAETGEGAACRRRHAGYFAALAEMAAPLLETADQGAWLDRLEADHDNLRAAVRWCAESGETETGLRLGGALWMFWFMRGYLREGRDLLGRLLALPATRHQPALCARALNGLAYLMRNQGDFAAARPLMEESVAIRRALGDRRGLAGSLSNLAGMALEQGEYALARRLYDEHLALCRGLGDELGAADALDRLGILAFYQGDHTGARALLHESLAIVERLGDKQAISWVASKLGEVALSEGDWQTAARWYGRHHALAHEVGHRAAIAEAELAAGLVAFQRGDPDEAERLFESNLRLVQECGYQLGLPAALLAQALIAQHRGRHSRAAAFYGDAFARLQAMGDRRAMALCLERLASLLGDVDQPHTAARLLGAAAALRGAIGAPAPPCEQARLARLGDALRARLGPAALAEAPAAGAAATLNALVAEAVAAVERALAPAEESPLASVPGPRPHDRREAAPGLPVGLTRRELAVLRLLAAGRTTKEIAAELVVSPRTVERHIANLYRKIGARGRADAAGFAHRHGLMPARVP
jgi:non-specific serine/threonine protein kinase